MGLLQDAASHPLVEQFRSQSTGLQVAIGLVAFIFFSIVLNVANQILFKKANEPPMVFHWVPFFGSTITYGMDPPAFFEKNRKKVSKCRFELNYVNTC